MWRCPAGLQRAAGIRDDRNDDEHQAGQRRGRNADDDVEALPLGERERSLGQGHAAGYTGGYSSFQSPGVGENLYPSRP